MEVDLLVYVIWVLSGETRMSMETGGTTRNDISSRSIHHSSAEQVGHTPAERASQRLF